MNHKPGSVLQSLRLCSFEFCFAKLKWSYPSYGTFTAAICLKKAFPSFFCSLPALNRRVAVRYLTLLLIRLAFPVLSLIPRWALTPPFHPYQSVKGLAVYFLRRCLSLKS